MKLDKSRMIVQFRREMTSFQLNIYISKKYNWYSSLIEIPVYTHKTQANYNSTSKITITSKQNYHPS